MKYTVHVTLTFSVEVDAKELKAEFGKVNKKMIYQEAINKASISGDHFDSKAVVFDVEKPVKQKVSRGIGSY